MKVADLPDKVFMTGTRESEINFAPNVHKLSDGLFLICVWTSQDKLNAWLAAREQPIPFFDVSTVLAFATVVMSRGAVRHILVDPRPNENPYADSFSLDSFPSDRKIDGHSTESIWIPLSKAYVIKGTTPEIVEAMHRFAISHPDVKSFELADRYALEIQLRTSFMDRSSRELQEDGLFDQAWIFLKENTPLGQSPPYRQQLVREVWETHLDFLAKDALEYASQMDHRTVGDLKRTGDFERMWRSALAGFKETGANDEMVQNIGTRDVVHASDDLTFQQALEKASRIVSGNLAQLPKALQTAILQFPPPKACDRCGEEHWALLSLSPNEKSAKYQCEYCRKEVVVKAEDVQRRTASSGREPIPKEVQREIWQRDGGKCVRCSSQERLEFDHIIPLAKGGANTARNLQLLCEVCNRQKSDMAPGQY